jgi:hypothetical protein
MTSTGPAVAPSQRTRCADMPGRSSRDPFSGDDAQGTETGLPSLPMRAPGPKPSGVVVQQLAVVRLTMTRGAATMLSLAIPRSGIYRASRST